MLANQIGHGKGKLTGTRVLAPVENEVTLEMSFQGEGEMLGVKMTDMGTSLLTFRSDGMIESKSGNIVIFGENGAIARLHSTGLGKLFGPVPQGRYVSTGMFETTSPCWKNLREIVGIFEFVVNEHGEYTVKVWAWA
ncbi:MAG: hypothetical protein U0798_12720 [Gemmataceae bacterium]